MDKEIIKEATEMTKNISGKDVLTPMQLEDENLTPFPKVEYKIIESPTMDKLIRDVNTHLKNGRQTKGGVQIISGTTTRFFQSLIRQNVDYEVDKTIHIVGLENEPDLYEDIEKNADE